MNIIWNIPIQDKMSEIQEKLAKWHWERIKTQIKNSDLTPEQKQAAYESLKNKVFEVGD